MTVRDNIRFAKPDLEQAAVEQAAELAFINQEIKAFPEGHELWNVAFRFLEDTDFYCTGLDC